MSYLLLKIRCHLRNVRMEAAEIQHLARPTHDAAPAATPRSMVVNRVGQDAMSAQELPHITL